MVTYCVLKMSSRREHKKRGAQIGLGEYLESCQKKNQKPGLIEAIFFSWLGSVSATVPDIVDSPSKGPTHRSWAHCAEAYTLVRNAYIKAKAEGNVALSVCLRSAMSHLEEDAKTPAGLPSASVLLVRRILGIPMT